MRVTVTLLCAAAAVLAFAGAPAAAGEPDHTFSGTVSVPVWLPPGAAPSFTLELEDVTVESRDVSGGGILTLTFSGSASEPVLRTQSCPGRGLGSRLRLSGLGAGTTVSATYSSTGMTFVTPAVAVPADAERVTTSVCAR